MYSLRLIRVILKDKTGEKDLGINYKGDGIMSATGLFIFLIAIIGIAVLGALIAVIAAVSGASAAISDEEDGLEENA